jgi:hypothetical protein
VNQIVFLTKGVGVHLELNEGLNKEIVADKEYLSSCRCRVQFSPCTGISGIQNVQAEA